MTSDEIIKITPDQLQNMIHNGVISWFCVGLRGLSTWKLDYHECVVIDKQKFLLAKIKYGI